MDRKHHSSCRCNFCVLQRNVRLRWQERREIERGANLPPGFYLYETPGDHPVTYEDEVGPTGQPDPHTGANDGSATVHNQPPSQTEPPDAGNPPGGTDEPAAAAPLSPSEKRWRGRWGYYWAAALALIVLGVAGVAVWLYAFDGADTVAALWREPASPASSGPQVSDAELDAMIAAALTKVAPTPTQIPPQPTATPWPTDTPQPTATPQPVAITNNSTHDSQPAWSPDGSRIAFTSGRHLYGRDNGIFAIDANGSPFTRLTKTSINSASWPAWSPDGSQIAFAATHGRDENLGIFVMNADGSSVTLLTDDSAGNSEPAWSPDGSRIAFSSVHDYASAIFVMNADGSEFTQLTNNGEYAPAWSPDGQRIAFNSSFGGAEIFVMNADGSAVTQLTHGDAYNSDPAWSPDGQRIAFVSDRGGVHSAQGSVAEIYLMDADGSNITQLTHTYTGYAIQPAWSPDGSRIAFASNRDGDYEIYVMAVPP